MSIASHEHEPSSISPPGATRPEDWRAEWQAFEDFVEQVLGELDQVREIVQRKAHEIELTEAKLAEREKQLTARTEEEEKLRQAFQRQETQLAEALQALDRLSGKRECIDRENDG
jgi:chromosome segregation ATPase